MIIDSTNSKLQALQYQQRTDWHEKVKHKEHRHGYRPEHSYSDRSQFSDVAKLSGTRLRKLDLDKQPEAEHALNIQIISSMVKKITGQDLQLISPQALQDPTEQVSVQEPTNAPQQSTANDTGLVYQQSLAYFESQTTTFSAQGVINTKDGQKLEFSVSLSMSRTFYAGFDSAQPDSGQSDEGAMSVNFSGTAAELTTTHFQFSLDNLGSNDQVDIVPADQELSAQQPISVAADEPTASRKNTSDDGVVENRADINRLTAAVKSIYKQLRIWQHHMDGGTQLLALGTKSIGALYLGHLTASIPPLPSEHEVGSVETGNNNALPTNKLTNAEQQINFTA